MEANIDLVYDESIYSFEVFFFIVFQRQRKEPQENKVVQVFEKKGEGKTI